MGLAERFFALFAGLTRAHGVYEITEKPQPGKKLHGRAYTVIDPVTVELWQRHLDGEQGLGVIPIRDDATVRFAAIDIDNNSIDHLALERQLAELELPLVVCRSKSGGAHCYLFLRDDANAGTAQAKMTRWAAAVGYPKAEVFPKQVALAGSRDVGNWINMPYFSERDEVPSIRRALLKGAWLDAPAFLVLAEARSLTAAQLAEIDLPLPQAPEGGDLDDAPPCLLALAAQGFGEGTRNNTLFNLAVYTRLRYGEHGWQDALRELNDKHMRPALPESEVRGILRSVGKKEYCYTCTRPPIRDHCNKDVCKTLKWGIGGLNEIPNVMISKLTKIKTVPPTWVATVNDQRVELTTEELMLQGAFKMVVMEKLNKVVKAIRQNAWDRLIEKLTETMEEVEAPNDAGPEGQFLHHVEQFCTGRAQARSKDELLQGKPWTEEGRTYFRSSDLIRYLDQQHFKAFKQREMWTIVQRHVGMSHSFKLKGKQVQCWSLPEFEQQKEDYDVPRPEEEI